MEIELGDYIRAMMVDLALKVGAVAPGGPMVGPTSTLQPSETSQVPAVGKGKGPLIPFLKKKALLAQLEGIIIDTSADSEPLIFEEEEEPMWGRRY